MNVPETPSRSPAHPGRPRRRGDIPVGEILGWLGRWKVALALGAGVVFRLAGYLSGRDYWMDEGSLVENIRSRSLAGFFGPLERNQLAPPGFLVAVRASVAVFGDNPYAMRLVPMAGGIAGLFLFLALARRVLPGGAVFPAILLFASARDPIYYSSEVKQYSTDLAIGLLCWLAALTIGRLPLTASRAAWLASVGAVLVWFSHPSIFILAGVGLVGVARAVGSRDWRGVVAWGWVGLAWLASFAGVHAVATRQLDGSDQMWRFWDFAFPPMPPRSLWDASWVARRLAFVFLNPLNFDAPFGERLSMLPALTLAVLGAWRLWKLDRWRWALLMIPVASTMAASALRLYPFHGRLILFLAPVPLLAIAAGLQTIGELAGRRWLSRALAAMVLVVPLASACYWAFDPWPNHNRFGDLHPDDTVVNPYKFPF